RVSDAVSLELGLPRAFLNDPSSQFQAGDYIEMDVELVLPPRLPRDYYGNSQRLVDWMTAADVETDFTNGWKVVAMEANKGDDIAVQDLTQGSLERKYPPRIRVDDNDEAMFKLAIPSDVPGVLPITLNGVGKTNLMVGSAPPQRLWRYDGTAWQEFGSGGDYQLNRDVHEQTVALLVTYLNIVLYALCFQLQRPVEPFLVKSLQEGNDSASVTKSYGRLQSFFNAVQTVGSPLVGILLDKVGIQKASVMVFGATGLSYLILAYATDMNLLFLSKVPTILMAAFLVAQATASTATGGDATARAAALGRMTTAYTIGATVGPALGGWLADRGDLYFSAKLAVLGSLASVVLSWLYLPNAKQSKQEKGNDKEVSSFTDSLRASLLIGLRPSVWPLLTVKLLGGVVASIFSTALPLVLTQKIGFDASQLGVTMSASMFSVAVFAGVFMAPMAKAVGPDGMAKMGLFGRAVMAPAMAALVSLAVFKSGGATDTNLLVLQVAAISTLHALSAHSLATGLTTQTTGAVENDEQGALLGLEHSLFSLARIAGPSIGTMLLASASDESEDDSSSHQDGFWRVATCCAVIDLLLLAFLFYPRKMPARTKVN
ncbi:MAG: hypothetical protein SGILL_007041, partial [Bacillariaceae sp.]